MVEGVVDVVETAAKPAVEVDEGGTVEEVVVAWTDEATAEGPEGNAPEACDSRITMVVVAPPTTNAETRRSVASARLLRLRRLWARMYSRLLIRGRRPDSLSHLVTGP